MYRYNQNIETERGRERERVIYIYIHLLTSWHLDNPGHILSNFPTISNSSLGQKHASRIVATKMPIPDAPWPPAWIFKSHSLNVFLQIQEPTTS